MPQYLASSPAARPASLPGSPADSGPGPVAPLPDAPTLRCAPPAFLLELSTPPFLEEPTLRCAIPTILVDLPELDALVAFPGPLADTATLRSPLLLGDDASVPALLDDAPLSASLTAAFLAARDDAPATVPTPFDDALFASPWPLREAPTARCQHAPPAPLPDFATARYAPGDDAPAPLRDSSTVRHSSSAAPPPRDSSTARCFVSRNGVQLPVAAAPVQRSSARRGDRTARAFSFVDEDSAIHEILDEVAAHHSLPSSSPSSLPRSLPSSSPSSSSRRAPASPPDASATCLAIPLASAEDFDDASELYECHDDFDDCDDRDDFDDFEPVPTILDNIPTLAAPQAPDAPPRWAIGLSRDEGLELVLAIPAVPPPPDGPFPLSLPLRQQMITALEARVGVSLDSSVRRDLLDEDLRLPLIAGAVRVSLDLADGEILFGAPLYHAWLAHERELSRLRHDPTRPGLPARPAQGQLP